MDSDNNQIETLYQLLLKLQPAHVHVIGRGCEAVFKLHCPNGNPELRENYGFSKKNFHKSRNI
jgi:hypothetical protein